ncbi:MAG TPA: serine hydrolase domain-containing protein, partial [Flavobacteriales bacterium]|nr:serine hydrolase domain-containing protein [Flavobacteriales bacterium]
MIYARLITVVFLFCSSFAVAQRVDLRKIDHYTENARKEWDCPGLAIGIIHNDSVVFAKGYGTISSDSEKPVDANTLFGIASNTKAFTAAAIATFVDDKKIEWDEKVVQLLPYFRLYNDYVTNEITIRDILSHSTGLRTFIG